MRILLGVLLSLIITVVIWVYFFKKEESPVINNSINETKAASARAKENSLKLTVDLEIAKGSFSLKENQMLIINKKNILKYISKDNIFQPILADECQGYVVIENVDNNIKNTPYIKCKNIYSTNNFKEQYLE